MPPDVLMTIFVATAAIALLIQAFLLFGIYKSTRQVQARVAEFQPRIETLLASTQSTVEQSRKQIGEITTKANEILDATKVQLGRVDVVIADATTRARTQLERIDLVMDDTLTRVQETVAVLHKGVIRPLRQINGVSAGVRAALQSLVKGSPPDVSQATQDEELFI
jgi:hypothetical protein